MIRPFSGHTLLFITSIVFSFTVSADIGAVGGNAIGKIGSPVVPSNLPKPPPKAKTSPAQKDDDSDDDKETPKERPVLLDISFSQNHVNFQSALKQTIIENEKNFPGTVYEVVSSIPNNNDNPSKAARLNGVYTGNLNAVVQQMQSIGLQQNRIHTSTAYKDDGSDQDVIIYGAPQ